MRKPPKSVRADFHFFHHASELVLRMSLCCNKVFPLRQKIESEKEMPEKLLQKQEVSDSLNSSD